jgi:hypothetical protein
MSLSGLLNGDEADAASLRVPQDYPTITEAANIAQAGDSILVWSPPGGGDWESQHIMLGQGVTLRGMVPNVNIQTSDIHLLESLSMQRGIDDTTRVENLFIGTAPFHEAVQVFTPRSSIKGCRIGSSGPLGWSAVRIWKGGAIVGNIFVDGGGEGDAIAAREGTITIAWNLFRVFRGFWLFNEEAEEPADLSFHNNTLRYVPEIGVFLRPDSQAEFVNCIFYDSCYIFCSSGNLDIRYNDFYGSGSQCPLGVGNIFADPMFCEGHKIHPDSPCVGSGEGGANMGAWGICGVTGLGDLETPKPTLGLSVTPNPVRSNAEFALEGNAEPPLLEIYSADGRLMDVLRFVAGRVRWERVSSVPRGQYFARVDNGRRSKTVKFVVIR